MTKLVHLFAHRPMHAPSCSLSASARGAAAHHRRHDPHRHPELRVRAAPAASSRPPPQATRPDNDDHQTQTTLPPPTATRRVAGNRATPVPARRRCSVTRIPPARERGLRPLSRCLGPLAESRTRRPCARCTRCDRAVHAAIARSRGASRRGVRRAARNSRARNGSITDAGARHRPPSYSAITGASAAPHGTAASPPVPCTARVVRTAARAGRTRRVRASLLSASRRGGALQEEPS